MKDVAFSPITVVMTCRDFRAHHCAFVDDTLSLLDMAAMREHLERCASCAHHDTRVRRSLLLVRNSPRVECSPDFGPRLEARIRAMGPVDRCGTAAGDVFPSGMRYAALAAGVVTVAAMAALAAGGRFDRGTPELQMAPVVASVPEPAPLPAGLTTPEYVASVMSGMPVWPAVLEAGQSSMHLANYEFQLTGYTR